RAVARDDGTLPPHARDADAVSGAGVRRVDAVSVLRRSRPRSGDGREEGTRGVPDAVSEREELRADGSARRPGRPADVRAVQARFRRARVARGELRLAPRSAATAPRR